MDIINLLAQFHGNSDKKFTKRLGFKALENRFQYHTLHLF